MPAMTKKEVLEALARGEGCLGKAKDDEPLFILRGQDLIAPPTIEFWATETMQRSRTSDSMNKAQAALREASEIRHWQAMHHDRVKVAD
jgi:hypothetical protein